MSFDLRHALTVAGKFEYGTAEWLVALCHDALEDTDLTLYELRGMIGVSRANAVAALTRTDGEPYHGYIESLADGDELPRLVKLADVEANLARMDSDHASLRPRYEHARTRLSAAEEPRCR